MLEQTQYSRHSQQKIIFQNINRVNVLSHNDITSYDFLDWLYKAWFVVNEEGLVHSMFDKQELVKFFKDMVYCPYARRYYKTKLGDEFHAQPEIGEVTVNDDPAPYLCEICVSIDGVGHIYFSGSFILYHDLTKSILHIGYFD